MPVEVRRKQGLEATHCCTLKHCLHELYSSRSAGTFLHPKGTTMNSKLITAIALATLASLAGCNNAKSPDTVANDVAAAQQAAAKQVADARAEASKDDAKANNEEAAAAYDVAVAKAEGAHKVALEKCNALGGDAQSKCKDQADADFAAAKANSKAAEVAAKQ